MTGLALAVLGASLFSIKGVFMKLAFAEGASVEQMMALRMALSLPVFIVVGWLSVRARQKDTQSSNPKRQDYWRAMGLGVLAYYVCTWLDFTGLMYISAQLERLILFIYPTFVAILAWRLFGERITRYHALALGLSYAGVGVLALTEFHGANVSIAATANPKQVLVGGGLVLICAILFAVYVIGTKGSISRLGAPLFTSLSMSAAAIVILVHFGAQSAIGPAPVFSPNIFALGLALAIPCTVMPGFLIAESISRIGPGLTSAVGGIGPAVAAIAAVMVLDEPFGWPQATALVLSVSGVLLLSRSKTR